jgi:hypothetical protein
MARVWLRFLCVFLCGGGRLAAHARGQESFTATLSCGERDERERERERERKRVERAKERVERDRERGRDDSLLCVEHECTSVYVLAYDGNCEH